MLYIDLGEWMAHSNAASITAAQTPPVDQVGYVQSVAALSLERLDLKERGISDSWIYVDNKFWNRVVSVEGSGSKEVV